MAIKRYFRRKRKGRGDAKTSQPFIQAESAQPEGMEGNSFFLPREMEVQAKTKVSEAGDEQEREADAAADRAVRHKEEKKRRKAAEDKAKHLGKDKHERHDPEEEKVQRKEAKGGSPAGAGRATAIAGASGDGGTIVGASGDRGAIAAGSGAGGAPLPAGVLHEMSGSMGYDFSTVKIHTDPEAQEMSERLGAQAFTHGSDVYFNRGKYDPQTKEGKWLLAHELAHVVQQREGARIQRKDVAEISTPVPEDFTVEKSNKAVVAASGDVHDVHVKLLRDIVGKVDDPNESAHTNAVLNVSIPDPKVKAGKITKVSAPVWTLTVRTTYRKEANPSAASKYGRGATEADKKAGNTSVRFHEGSHGSSAIDYIASHPLPVFEGKDGMTTDEYKKAQDKFTVDFDAYNADLQVRYVEDVDCTKEKPGPKCKK